MENKLNREGIKKYSERFTSAVIDNFLKDRDRVSGAEILEIQPIKQVGLFVIKNLFRKWQKETTKLKSKYFHYESSEVKEALKEFMNVLSRHISIQKSDFVPLFQSATEETILLIFSPYDFYTHILERNGDSIALTDLKKISKYVQVNKTLINILIKNLEEQQIKILDSTNLPSLLDEVFASIQDTPEDIEEYLKMFTAVIPLSENDIYAEDEATIAQTNGKDVDSNANIELQEKKKTLHDELASESQTTIANIHERQKISSITQSLTINQRFMFVNSLFEGDEDQFQRTVEVLESHGTYELALGHIREQFPGWDEEGDEAQEFLELVKKRLG